MYDSGLIYVYSSHLEGRLASAEAYGLCAMRLVLHMSRNPPVVSSKQGQAFKAHITEATIWTKVINQH